MNHVEARRHLVQTSQETGSISATARYCHTSRQVVRKWLRRFQEEQEAGLYDRSHCPAHAPRQTPAETERQSPQAWQAKRYGRNRLALYLQTQGLFLSPHTIRHILRRHRPSQAQSAPQSPLPCLMGLGCARAFFSYPGGCERHPQQRGLKQGAHYPPHTLSPATLSVHRLRWTHAPALSRLCPCQQPYQWPRLPRPGPCLATCLRYPHPVAFQSDWAQDFR